MHEKEKLVISQWLVNTDQYRHSSLPSSLYYDYSVAYNK